MPHGRSETAHQAVAISQELRAVSAYQNRLTPDVDPEQAFRGNATFTLRDVRTSLAGAVQLTVTLDNNIDVMSYGGGFDGWSQNADVERNVDNSFRRMVADILRTAGVHRGDSAEISMHDTTGVLAHDVFTGFFEYGQQGIASMAEALGDRIKAMSSYRDTPWSLGPHIKFIVTVVRGVHGGDAEGVSSKDVVIIRGHENCVGKAAFLGAMYSAYNDMRGYKTEEILKAVGLNPGEDPIAWLGITQRWEAHCRISGEARRTGEPPSVVKRVWQKCLTGVDVLAAEWWAMYDIDIAELTSIDDLTAVLPEATGLGVIVRSRNGGEPLARAHPTEATRHSDFDGSYIWLLESADGSHVDLIKPKPTMAVNAKCPDKVLGIVESTGMRLHALFLGYMNKAADASKRCSEEDVFEATGFRLNASTNAGTRISNMIAWAKATLETVLGAPYSAMEDANDPEDYVEVDGCSVLRSQVGSPKRSRSSVNNSPQRSRTVTNYIQRAKDNVEEGSAAWQASIGLGPEDENSDDLYKIFTELTGFGVKLFDRANGTLTTASRPTGSISKSDINNYVVICKRETRVGEWRFDYLKNADRAIRGDSHAKRGPSQPSQLCALCDDFHKESWQCAKGVCGGCGRVDCESAAKRKEILMECRGDQRKAFELEAAIARAYQCHLCNTLTLTQECANVHAGCHKPSDRPTHCGRCMRSFATYIELQKHLGACPICLASMPTRKKFEEHFHNVHPDADMPDFADVSAGCGLNVCPECDLLVEPGSRHYCVLKPMKKKEPDTKLAKLDLESVEVSYGERGGRHVPVLCIVQVQLDDNKCGPMPEIDGDNALYEIPTTPPVVENMEIKGPKLHNADGTPMTITLRKTTATYGDDTTGRFAEIRYEGLWAEYGFAYDLHINQLYNGYRIGAFNGARFDWYMVLNALLNLGLRTDEVDTTQDGMSIKRIATKMFSKVAKDMSHGLGRKPNGAGMSKPTWCLMDDRLFSGGSLDALPKKVGLSKSMKLKKGYWPHLYRPRLPELDKNGVTYGDGPTSLPGWPELQYFSPQTQTDPGFQAWYETAQRTPFDYWTELATYCRQDVTIERVCMWEFRKLWMTICDEFNSDFDPFMYTTTPSAGRAMFLSSEAYEKMHKEGRGIPVTPISTLAEDACNWTAEYQYCQWLQHRLDEDYGGAVVGRSRWTPDGQKRDGRYGADFFAEPDGRKIWYDLDGCFTHGCDRPGCIYSKRKDVATKVKKLNTQHRNKVIKAMGYEHVIMPMCEWLKMMHDPSILIESFSGETASPGEAFRGDPERGLVGLPTNPHNSPSFADARSAMGGGCTEVYAHVAEPDPLTRWLMSLDFTSLYPNINITAKYPAGIPEELHAFKDGPTLDKMIREQSIGGRVGFLKVTYVQSNRDMYPSVALKIAGKSIRTCCGPCAEIALTLDITCKHNPFGRPLQDLKRERARKEMSDADINEFERLSEIGALSPCAPCVYAATRVECNHTDEEREVTKTLMAFEVEDIIRAGGRLVSIHHFVHYPKATSGVFAAALEPVYKIKVLASGKPSFGGTDAEKEKQKELWWANLTANWIECFGHPPTFTYDEIYDERNEGLREMAKLILVSFWGRFSIDVTAPKPQYVSSPSELQDLVRGSNGEVSIPMLFDRCVVVLGSLAADKGRRNHSADTPLIGCYTTGIGRRMIIDVCHALLQNGTPNVYGDTDSCKALLRKLVDLFGGYLIAGALYGAKLVCKPPSGIGETREYLIGDGLGQLKIEYYMKDFCALAAKAYELTKSHTDLGVPMADAHGKALINPKSGKPYALEEGSFKGFPQHSRPGAKDGVRPIKRIVKGTHDTVGRRIDADIGFNMKLTRDLQVHSRHDFKRSAQMHASKRKVLATKKDETGTFVWTVPYGYKGDLTPWQGVEEEYGWEEEKLGEM